jgi:hypothetical protein
MSLMLARATAAALLPTVSGAWPRYRRYNAYCESPITLTNALNIMTARTRKAYMGARGKLTAATFAWCGDFA